jgi:hypothetical protein
MSKFGDLVKGKKEAPAPAAPTPPSPVAAPTPVAKTMGDMSKLNLRNLVAPKVSNLTAVRASRNLSRNSRTLGEPILQLSEWGSQDPLFGL